MKPRNKKSFNTIHGTKSTVITITVMLPSITLPSRNAITRIFANSGFLTCLIKQRSKASSVSFINRFQTRTSSKLPSWILLYCTYPSVIQGRQILHLIATEHYRQKSQNKYYKNLQFTKNSLDLLLCVCVCVYLPNGSTPIQIVLIYPLPLLKSYSTIHRPRSHDIKKSEARVFVTVTEFPRDSWKPHE